MVPEPFGLFDILVGVTWMFIVITIGFVVWAINKDKSHYKYFMPALFFKIIFATIFAVTYVFILEGGDTIAYWRGAVSLNGLFWDSPMNYLTEMIQTPNPANVTKYYNSDIGYPPGWIYPDPKSWFICKLASPLTFLTFNSFYGITMIFTGFIFGISWKFFEFVKDFEFCKNWILVFASLFIPTVAFWSSGLSKDTVVLGSTQVCVIILFSFLFKERSINFKNIMGLIIFGFILYSTRSFMLVVLSMPYFVIISLRLIKKYENKAEQWVFKTILFLVVVTVTGGYLALNSSIILENTYLEDLAVKQQDFAVNKTYTGPRYNLGITEFSPVGMIEASPRAIAASFYRPYLWEASSPFLLLSAIEGTILIYLTFSFFLFSGRPLAHLAYISNQEFLTFAVTFVLIFGFLVGFTSGLLNVLIRFKAPLMTFLFIVLSAKRPHRIKKNKKTANYKSTYSPSLK